MRSGSLLYITRDVPIDIANELPGFGATSTDVQKYTYTDATTE